MRWGKSRVATGWKMPKFPDFSLTFQLLDRNFQVYQDRTSQHKPWLPARDVSNRWNTYMYKRDIHWKVTSIWSTPNSISDRWYINHILEPPIGTATNIWTKYLFKNLKNFPDQSQISLTFFKILNFQNLLPRRRT